MTETHRSYPINWDLVDQTIAKEQNAREEQQIIHKGFLPGGMYFTARVGIPVAIGGSILLLSACGFDLNRSYDDQFRNNTPTPGSPSRKTAVVPSSPGQQSSPGQNAGCRDAEGDYYTDQTPTEWILEECVRDDNRKLDTSIWRKNQTNVGVAWDGKSRRKVEPINVSKMKTDTETRPLQDGINMSCSRSTQSCDLVNAKKSKEDPQPTQALPTLTPLPVPTEVPTVLASVETVPAGLTGSIGLSRSSESDSTQPDLSVFIPPCIMTVVVFSVAAVVAVGGRKIVEEIKNQRAGRQNTGSSEIVSAGRVGEDPDRTIILHDPVASPKNPPADAVF